MKMSRTEVIDADPARVWEFLIAVERWPDVMDHIDRIVRHDDGPFRLGSSATLEQPRLPATIWTVDEFRPGISFRWSGAPLGMAWSADHVVEPAGDGASRLTLTVIATGWRSVLAGPFLKRAARRALGLEFAGVRADCE